eukprot:g16191.t1
MDMRSRARREADEREKAKPSYVAHRGGATDMNGLNTWVKMDDENHYARLGEDTVMVTVTHSNLNQKHVDLRFDLHTTVFDVKKRLALHNGTPPGDQKLYVKDGDMIVGELDDDTRKIGFYSIQNGQTLHVVDTNPYSMSANGGLEDTSLVKKYEMSDEEYNKRKNTLRSYKREMLKKDPNFKFDWSQAGKNGLKGVKGKENEGERTYPGPESVAGMKVGNRCEVNPGARRGEIMYLGEVKELLPGHWVGVKFDEPLGKNDGSVKGTRYFQCANRYGGFCRASNLQVGDFPEADLFADLSDSDEDEI